jgi:3-oxoacyl-[acyl-carrier-protein] synthase-3
VPETSLAETAACLADESLPLEKIATSVGLSDADVRRYRRFFGLDSVRWSPASEVGDLLLAAARQLTTLPGNEHRVRYVIHARSLEPAAPYSANPLHRVAAALGLRHAAAFTVSQHACASGLLAVQLAGQLLAAGGDPGARALVLTGEKTYPHISRYMPAVTVFGEASAACLVTLGGDHDRVVAYATVTLGEFHRITERSPRFDQAYPPALASLMRSAAASAGLDLDAIAMVFPHNVNRMTWTATCRLAGLPPDRIWLENVPVTGHCFCADPFVNLVTALQRGALRPGDHYLMVSVGLGATFSAMVMRH